MENISFEYIHEWLPSLPIPQLQSSKAIKMANIQKKLHLSKAEMANKWSDKERHSSNKTFFLH